MQFDHTTGCSTQLLQFSRAHFFDCIVCCAPCAGYRIKRGVWIWPSIYAVRVATSSENDDILVIIRVLVVLSELDLVDRGATFGSMFIIPVNDWPLFPAQVEVEVHRPSEE